MPSRRESFFSPAWLNLLQGCWSRGLKDAVPRPDLIPAEERRRDERLNTHCAETDRLNGEVQITKLPLVCQPSLSQQRGSPHSRKQLLTCFVRSNHRYWEQWQAFWSILSMPSAPGSSCVGIPPPLQGPLVLDKTVPFAFSRKLLRYVCHEAKLLAVSYWRFMGGSDRNRDNPGRFEQSGHFMHIAQSSINTGDCAFR